MISFIEQLREHQQQQPIRVQNPFEKLSSETGRPNPLKFNSKPTRKPANSESRTVNQNQKHCAYDHQTQKHNNNNEAPALKL
jgi:hypothetical protein